MAEKSNNILIRYPDYVEKFKCVNSQCYDNCCKNWTVYIDKNTYIKYKDMNNDFIISNIIVNPNRKNDSEYGTIKMKKQCPFLDLQGLCRIQNQYGVSYLSNVCRNYPRIINKVDGVYELSLDLSCIEAAKIVLLNREKTKIVEKNEANEEYYKNNLYDQIESIDIYTLFEQIRKCCLFIVKKTNSLQLNLYQLGIFLYRTQKLMNYYDNDGNELIKIYNKSVRETMPNKDKFFYMMQLSFFKNLIKDVFLKMNDLSVEFKEILLNIEKTYNFNKVQGIIKNQYKYISIYEEAEKTVFKKYDYIFKNYIITHIFSELFPFNQNDILFDAYIILIVRVSFIKLCIMERILAGYEIDENFIVKIISILTKELSHRQYIFSNILGFIRKYELDNKKIIEILL